MRWDHPNLRRVQVRILDEIDAYGPLTRQELSDRLGEHLGSVCRAVMGLMRRRIIEDEGLLRPRGGRPAMLLRLRQRPRGWGQTNLDLPTRQGEASCSK